MSDITETKKRPYAGQAWKADLFADSPPVMFLAILERDLLDDARANDVPWSRIEFWVNESKQLKGFFMGDTTSLTEEGWALAGTL